MHRCCVLHPLTRRYAVRDIVIEVSELSSTKDYLFEMQELHADEWIRERLSDDSLDEDSEEYQELAEEYSNYQEHLR